MTIFYQKLKSDRKMSQLILCVLSCAILIGSSFTESRLSQYVLYVQRKQGQIFHVMYVCTNGTFDRIRMTTLYATVLLLASRLLRRMNLIWLIENILF